jgi:hypothetical protein
MKTILLSAALAAAAALIAAAPASAQTTGSISPRQNGEPTRLPAGWVWKELRPGCSCGVRPGMNHICSGFTLPSGEQVGLIKGNSCNSRSSKGFRGVFVS